jgi:hypothetical protein
MSAPNNPREGDESLSVKRGGKSGGTGRDSGSGRPPKGPKKPRRASDLGRALRSVYDDTLREPVPDDFLQLIGKLGN